MGDYDIQVVRTEGDGEEKTIWTGQSFKVDEYKLPTMKASVAGPKEAAVRPTDAAARPVRRLSLGRRRGRTCRSNCASAISKRPAPDGYDRLQLRRPRADRGRQAAQRRQRERRDEESTPLPPTQTLPVTLGGDGTARTAIEVPQSARPERQHAGRDGLSGRQWRDPDRLAPHPDLHLGVQLGIKTDGWLMKQDDLRLRFVALDTSGKPLANQRSRSSSTAARSSPRGAG
jgi:hypothetical protein